MDLVIGGAFQGKLQFVLDNKNIPQDKIFDFKNHSAEELTSDYTVLYHFEDFIRNSHKTAEETAEFIMTEFKNSIVICSEVGAGIVPIKKEENDYREKVGRTLCILSRYADTVVRVTVGIPERIK